MNKMKPALVAASCLILSGCVPSLNPLYTDKDIIFDPALVGSWSGPNEKETWVFEKAGDKAYTLFQTDQDGRKARFQAHLLRLGEYRFLDLYLISIDEVGKEKVNDYATFALIPGHLFLKVTRTEPTLEMAFQDPDWLKEFVEKNPTAIRHTKIPASADQKDERIVLTAETKDLQNFVLKHIHDEKFFGDAGEFKKKTAN